MSGDLPKVLVVDDEPENLETFKRAFRRELRVVTASSGELALAELRREAFDVALVDYSMPDMNGVALLQRIRAERPDVSRVMLTGYPDLDAVAEAKADGLVATVLVKPFTKDAVLQVVGNAVRLRGMRAAVSKLRASV